MARRNEDKDKNKNTRTPTQQKHDHEERLREISEKYKTYRQLGVGLLITVGFCFASYCAMRAFEAAAGKETNVNAALSALAGLNLSQAAGYALAAIFGSAAYYNYRGRKKAEAAAARAASLEKELDPKRTGSGLIDGSNPEEDAL